MTTLLNLFKALGTGDRKTVAAMLPYKKEYAGATDERRTEMRTESICGYLQTNLNVTEAKAIAIMGQTRDDRTKVAQASYARGRMQFTYHMETAKPATPPAKSKRISAHIRAVATKFLAEFDGDVDAAIAVLKAMK
jgi:hypothetical protein